MVQTTANVLTAYRTPSPSGIKDRNSQISAQGVHKNAQSLNQRRRSGKLEEEGNDR